MNLSHNCFNILTSVKGFLDTNVCDTLFTEKDVAELGPLMVLGLLIFYITTKGLPDDSNGRRTFRFQYHTNIFYQPSLGKDVLKRSIIFWGTGVFVLQMIQWTTWRLSATATEKPLFVRIRHLRLPWSQKLFILFVNHSFGFEMWIFR